MQDSTPHLSSSLEAEQRLLREMGWEGEEEEDDDWQISEDELREVQAKIKEFHRTQHRSLTPLTLNVLATTFQAVETKSLTNGIPNGIPNGSADVNKASSSSSDDQCTPTDDHRCNGFDEGNSSTLLFTGFENNNHKSFSSSPFPLNANGSDSSRLWNYAENSAISSGSSTAVPSVTGATDSDCAASTTSLFPLATLTTTTTNNRIWQQNGVSAVSAVGPSSEESDSDLSEVESD